MAAEDNAINRLVLKTLLKQAGVKPVIVDNGHLAVDAWESAERDVILLDMQMPVMDGISATKAIRARELATGRARTPIIALTANGMSEPVAEHLSSDMDGHVIKPIETRMLFEALERVLSAQGEVVSVEAKSA